MEIKVVGKNVSGNGLCPEIMTFSNLRTAFEYKRFRDVIAEYFEFETHVVLRTACRAIEVRKEHPRYRVMVDGNSRDVITDDFDLALSRCKLFWENDRCAILESWREFDDGVKCWKPVLNF